MKLGSGVGSGTGRLVSGSYGLMQSGTPRFSRVSADSKSPNKPMRKGVIGGRIKWCWWCECGNV